MITVYISADSIYEHSSVEITLTSESPFSVQVSGEIITLSSGKRKPDKPIIEAVKNNGAFQIKVELLRWLEERTVRHTRGLGPQNQYGMRFYPFVSSFLKGSITAQKSAINSVIVDLPDDFRLIWYRATVKSPNGKAAKLDHAYGPKRSKYLFTWAAEDKSVGEYAIKIPVRLGGSKILRLAEFPIFYWLLALVGVAIAAVQNKPSILVAAIAGVWTFMLRQWGVSNLPQRTTILTQGYIIAGTVILLWGVIWWKSQFWGYIMIAPVLIVTSLLYKSLRKFSYEGVLPELIERYWSKRIAKIDKRQARHGKIERGNRTR